MNTRTKERKEQEVKDSVHHELQITVPVLQPTSIKQVQYGT